MTSGVLKSQEEQRQFRTLKDELARLEKAIDGAKRLYGSYQIDKQEETRLADSLVELRKEKQKLSDIARAKELADAEEKRAKHFRSEASRAQQDTADAKEELERINRSIQDAEKRRDNIRIDTEEETRLHSAIETARKDLARLSGEIEPIKFEVKAETKKLEGLRADIKSEDEEYKRVSKLRTTQSAALKRENEVYDSVKSRHSDVSDAVKRIITETHKSIAAETKSARDELVLINSEIGKGKKELATMEPERKKAKELAEANADAEKTLTKQKSDIAANDRTIKAQKEKQTETESVINKKLFDFEAECAAKLAIISSKEKDLERREGKINRTVGWIKHRAGLLQQAKTELENFRGKELSHIVIPDVSDLE